MIPTGRTLAGLLLALGWLPAHALTVEFDYSFDDGPTPLSGGQRAVLDFVADQFGAAIDDSLDAAFYDVISFSDPGASAVGASKPGVVLNGQGIAADTLRIYAGAAELNGFGKEVLGVGGPGGGSIDDRGQSGIGTSDFAPWGGSISFDTSTDWYVDDDPGTFESFSGFDFYSVAIHELGHVLGVGTAGAWFSQVGATGFLGLDSVAAFADASGSAETAVPLDASGTHWADGTQSFADGVLMEAALDPSLATGRRKPYTELDWAALSDVGWQVSAVSPVPELPGYAMMLGGLGIIAAALRRRRAGAKPRS